MVYQQCVYRNQEGIEVKELPCAVALICLHLQGLSYSGFRDINVPTVVGNIRLAERHE